MVFCSSSLSGLKQISFNLTITLSGIYLYVYVPKYVGQEMHKSVFIVALFDYKKEERNPPIRG